MLCKKNWMVNQLSQNLRQLPKMEKHINNALKEELANIPTVANFATVQIEGGRKVNRNIDFYNLDMILSVGLTASQPAISTY